MTTPRQVLQAQLDAVQQDLVTSPAVVDPRLAVVADLSAQVASGEAWLDCDDEVIKAFVVKYLS